MYCSSLTVPGLSWLQRSHCREYTFSCQTWVSRCADEFSCPGQGIPRTSFWCTVFQHTPSTRPFTSRTWFYIQPTSFQPNGCSTAAKHTNEMSFWQTHKVLSAQSYTCCTLSAGYLCLHLRRHCKVFLEESI